MNYYHSIPKSDTNQNKIKLFGLVDHVPDNKN